MTTRIRTVLGRGLRAASFLMLCGLPGMSMAQDSIRKTPLNETFQRLTPDFWYISDGWSNGAHQNCTWSRKAVGIGPDGLTLSYLPPATAGGKALCGEIQTKPRFLYGTFEARIKTQVASGLNAAFFTYIGPVHNQPHDEIDFELLTRYPSKVWVNRYVSGKDFGEGRLEDLSSPINEAWHDFAFTWTPDSLRWYIDGKLVRSETQNIPSHPMKIYFSHWGTDTLTDWMGKFEMPAAPVVMQIKSLTYTPLGTTCAFKGSITCAQP
ncbi:glycosyl hydrolase family protein [Thioclava sp. BHET1]|nr:glycosyl hydrolase family protein [Thioclava sp. BHET1]